MMCEWEDEIFGQSARMALYFFFALFPRAAVAVYFARQDVRGAGERRSGGGGISDQ
jgi:hypothetical protein